MLHNRVEGGNVGKGGAGLKGELFFPFHVPHLVHLTTTSYLHQLALPHQTNNCS